LEQNARVVVKAEEYYRKMFEGRYDSWNRRDKHMVDTVNRLMAHLDQKTGNSKLVIWAHNSHLGNAKATEVGTQQQHRSLHYILR